MKKCCRILALIFIFNCFNQVLAQDGDGADALAKQLQNPVASLISVPIQANYDMNIGSEEGTQFLTNVQPVIPISISENWNLIGRAIVPIIKQCDVRGNSGKDSGLGDAVISGFFSPKAPTKGGIIWGVGPVLLVPTATKDILGTEKFGLGPTAVALKQIKSLTVGCLVNHIWSVAGADTRADVNATFFQPFIAKNFSGGYALAFNTELTQNWDYDATSGTFHIVASKVVSFGSQMAQVFAGPRIHYGNGNNAEWGIRAGLTLLFPTKS
ncbi:transporter [Aestuariibaculum sediminum]|uniref:Transporter n=1 Tax=Aestuariibaculum sediminum TaxID=2770637 RepID=A0A8J6Q0N8_9FLAO|nr:transporter [Aestuariibaculum sediminum]MBD0830636.1 transporter [Aestuariibaculum sediminum]